MTSMVADKLQGGVHMGHGQMVDIVDLGGGTWELAFSEAGKPGYQAPPIEEIKVDAIDTNGLVRSLAVRAGRTPSSVVASGNTANAHRARIMVMHGTHFHTREAAVPGATAAGRGTSGPEGGTVIAFDGGQSLEIVRRGEGRWLATFMAAGEKAKAPATAEVKAQAIGPVAEDYQVRDLIVLRGPDEFSLALSGRVGDATHIRLSIGSGDGTRIRSAAVG